MSIQSKFRLLSAACAVAVFSLMIVSAGRAMAADDAGWVELLEKGDFTKNWTTKGNWVTGKEGDVNLEPRPGESGWQRYDAYLWSKEQYKDFEVEFDYKVAANGNSGFYFHVGDQANPVADGIEVQIFDSAPKGADGKLNDHDSGGIIPGVPPTKNAAKPAGEWNHFHITCKGTSLTVKLNDVIVNEVDLSKGALGTRKPTGFIGFQDHGLPLGLRKIKVKKL
jgi:hypothetical protein